MMLSIEKTRSRTTIWPTVAAKARGFAGYVFGVFVWIDIMMDFARGLEHEKESARDQNKIAPGKRLAENREQRLDEMNDIGGAGDQQNAKNERQADADAPRLRRLLPRQSRRKNCDEDKIVDAKHDLHRDERDKGKPGRGVGGEQQKGIHGKVSRESLQWRSAGDGDFPRRPRRHIRMPGKGASVQGERPPWNARCANVQECARAKQASRAAAQPTTKLRPTAVSNVALAACSETAQVWSPTMPSLVTPPQV